MLIGLSLIEFPGKRRVEAKIVGQSTVLSTINAMRRSSTNPTDHRTGLIRLSSIVLRNPS